MKWLSFSREGEKLVKKGQESLRGKSLNIFELTKSISLRCVKCFGATLVEALPGSASLGLVATPRLLPHTPLSPQPCHGVPSPRWLRGHQHGLCVPWKHPEHPASGCQPAPGAHLLLGAFLTLKPGWHHRNVLSEPLWCPLLERKLNKIPGSRVCGSARWPSSGWGKHTHLLSRDTNLPLPPFETPPLCQLLNLGTGHSFVHLVTSPSLFTPRVDALAQNFKNVKKIIYFLGFV